MLPNSLLLLPFTFTALIRAARHDIQVGNDLSGSANLVFTPNVTAAAPGDTLVFHFYPGDHNVVQGEFNTPCVPSTGGFYSGSIDSESGEAQDRFTVTVNDTAPIWIYCSEGRHCQSGMVAAINPPSQALAAYAAGAATVNGSTTPNVVAGGVISPNPSFTSAVSSPTGTATATRTPGSTPTGTESASSPTETNGGLRTNSGASLESVKLVACFVVFMTLGGFY